MMGSADEYFLFNGIPIILTVVNLTETYGGEAICTCKGKVIGNQYTWICTKCTKTYIGPLKRY